MANTFISTDPKTKKQKTVNIPDGCIVVEMNTKEMGEFVSDAFGSFLTTDGIERIQVFPKEVKTFNGIWRYLFPIRRGVTAALVNKEKWEMRIKAIEAEKEKKKIEKLSREDIGEMYINFDEAKVFYLASKGYLTSIATKYLFPCRNDTMYASDYGKKLRDTILRKILEENNIDVPTLKKNISSANRQNRFFYYEFPVPEDQRNLLLNHVERVLLDTLNRKPLRKHSMYYLGWLKEERVKCYFLLKRLYRETGEVEKLRNTLTEIIFNLGRIKSNNDDDMVFLEKGLIESSVSELLYSLERDDDKKNETQEAIKKRHPKASDWCFDNNWRNNHIPVPDSHMNPESIDSNCAGSFEDARKAEKEGDYNNAANIYEAIVFNDNKNIESYSRLMIIYRKYHMYDDEIRVINLALKHCADCQKYVIQWRQRLKKAEEKRYKAFIESLEFFYHPDFGGLSLNNFIISL